MDALASGSCDVTLSGERLEIRSWGSSESDLPSLDAMVAAEGDRGGSSTGTTEDGTNVDEDLDGPPELERDRLIVGVLVSDRLP